MTKLAIFSLPIVRLVYYFAGTRNAMRVDVTRSMNSYAKATAIYAHEEAISSREDIAAVLSLASSGANTTEVDITVGLSKEEVWGKSGL